MEVFMRSLKKIAVVGCTGLVGRTALKVLEEKNFRGTVMDAVTACIEKSRTM